MAGRKSLAFKLLAPNKCQIGRILKIKDIYCDGGGGLFGFDTMGVRWGHVSGGKMSGRGPMVGRGRRA